MTPLVSIIITNYNYEKFLARCIDSALAQIHARTEVVVVDDASSDGSRDVICSYRDRVIPVLLEHNSGQGAAFNAGFRACNGDIVHFLDADDRLYPEATARTAAAFTTGVAQVQFRLDMEDGNGHHLDLLPSREVAFDVGDVVPLLLSRGRYETTVTSGNAFVRATLEAILPVPEEEFRISADGYLVTVAPLYGRVGAIDDPLGVYVLHGANNWTVSAAGDLPHSLRRSLEHDTRRYQALRRHAAQRGLVVTGSPGLRDPQHLTNRLGSLVVNSRRHPTPTDSRAVLGARGAWASRTARLPAARRLALAAWFLTVGTVPPSLAVRLVAWRMVPSSRPKWLARAMRRLRTWLR